MYASFVQRIVALLCRAGLPSAAACARTLRRVGTALSSALHRCCACVGVGRADAGARLRRCRCTAPRSAPTLTPHEWRSARARSSRAHSPTSSTQPRSQQCCAATRSTRTCWVRRHPHGGLLRRARADSHGAGALASRYLQHADVSFYTLVAVRRCAGSKRWAMRVQRAHLLRARLTLQFHRRTRLCDHGGLQGSGAGGTDSADVTRNAFDVLCSVPARFEAVDGTELSSAWCGWAPSADGSGKAHKRRPGKAASGAGTPRWADAASQRRAFSEAWLAFLRVELPMDIYKARPFFSLACLPVQLPRACTPRRKLSA